MYKDMFEFCTRGEIKNLLLSGEKLVYADNGIDEVVVKYKDLPDFIVDMSRGMNNNCNLKIYKYPAESMTPILTTIGEFLDRCDPDVRKDIIDRLIAVQTEEDTKSYRIINEYDLDVVKEEIANSLSIKINNLWQSDFGDIRCNASISLNGKERANIIASFDRDDYPDWKNSQEDYKEEIKENWEKYLTLPKISKCSKLLREIYDNVCESEATMCHITNDDWKEFYADKYSNKDIEKLKHEVKKYQLDDVITFNDGEYKILGWGNLETCFNDDRNIVRNRDKER